MRNSSSSRGSINLHIYIYFTIYVHSCPSLSLWWCWCGTIRWCLVKGGVIINFVPSKYMVYLVTLLLAYCKLALVSVVTRNLFAHVKWLTNRTYVWSAMWCPTHQTDMYDCFLFLCHLMFHTWFWDVSKCCTVPRQQIQNQHHTKSVQTSDLQQQEFDSLTPFMQHNTQWKLSSYLYKQTYFQTIMPEWSHLPPVVFHQEKRERQMQ